MKPYITAAAPRFIMRLFALRSLLRPLQQAGGLPRLLEIGPGLGDTAAWLRDFMQVQQLTLVEISAQARAILATRFGDDPAVSITPTFSPVSGQENLVLCFEVLEHLEDDAGMLARISDCLAPGGLFIGSVPAFMRKWQHVDDIAGHLRRYEKTELETKLRAAGLQVLQLRTYGFPITGLLYPLRQIYYRHKLASTKQGSAQEQTQKSGVARGLARLFNVSFVYALLWPFSRLQLLPLISEAGDGFVFICQKPEH